MSTQTFLVVVQVVMEVVRLVWNWVVTTDAVDAVDALIVDAAVVDVVAVDAVVVAADVVKVLFLLIIV
jgi:hypothetical protein